ncbi:MAG: hypothetical protein ACQEXB_05935 [Bacillota bacterium]
MINREMIEQIVREVVQQLAQKDRDIEDQDKSKLLVVGDTSFIEQAALLQLQKLWDVVQYDVESKVRLDSYKHVLFLHTTQDLLVKGALGIIDTPECKLLSRCLIESCPVTLIPTVYLQDQLLSESPKNKAYIIQLQRYQQTILEYGGCIETFERFIAATIQSEGPKQESVPESSKKRILTRRDIQDCTEKFLKVDSNTIITPLAKDTARELGVDIIEFDSKGAKM